jgi:hypothetical protein
MPEPAFSAMKRNRLWHGCMKKHRIFFTMPPTSHLLRVLLTVSVLQLAVNLSFAQTTSPTSGRTEMKQFAVYAEGNHTGMSDSVKYGVQIVDKTIINGGLVGSNFHVRLGAGNNVTSGLYSGNRISLAAGNVVNGVLVARNDLGVKFNTINVAGGNNQIGLANTQNSGLVQARGNVGVALSAGNTVQGPVRILQPYKYTGPAPANGPPVYSATLDMPTLPTLPEAVTFPGAGTKSITKTATLAPGNYKEIKLSGRNTITFSTPGVYVFQSIKSSGKNKFNFVVPSNSTDVYKIYVHDDVDLGPTEVTVNNAGPDAANSFPLASRIYTEVHGTGSTSSGGNAFRIKDTAKAAGIFAYWAGTVYATRGSIVFGSASSNDNYTAVYGALWSKTKIFLGNNVRFYFIPSSIVTSVIDPYYPPTSTGKVYDKIGSELTIVGESGDASSLSNDIFRFNETNTKILIEVIAISTNNAVLLSYLQSLGFELVSSAPDNLVLTGYFPFENLELLNGRTDIDYVRPLFEPIRNAGQVTTQGDTAMRSDAVRSRFGVEGSGVTVGIMSDSYASKPGLANDQQQGDLPTTLQVVKDFKGTDEGRAMAQIVYDVAPKANLVFRTGCITPLDFALGIKQLASAPYNCNVIVDDITYITEPFYKDGYIAQTVNNVVASNKVTYLSAAGNFGSKSYEGSYVRWNGTGVPAGIPGIANDFGGTAKQKIRLKKGAYTIVLQWNDQFYSLGGNTGALVDLDIYLIKPDGTYFGFNRNNRTGDPIEVLPFIANADTDAELLIMQDGSTTNIPFKLIIFRGEATFYNYAGSSTIVGQANAEGSLAVGAMLYGNVNNIVPDYPSVASFSSRGGLVINGTPRKKPDLIAPNGVNTTVTLNADPATNIENDPYPNFFGTSAAAPHAAAVAALFIEGKKKFNLQTGVLPSEVRDTLAKTARDLHESGFDYKSGNGAIQADAAMLTIANARPILGSLIPPAGLQPTNTTSFTLRVKGKYLNNKTKIYLRGAEIATVFVNTEEVRATISGTISDDPPFQLYNPAKSISGLDGGLSEALFLFSNKKLVTVQANNATKKFGEALPQFTFTVTVNGVPLSSSGVTLEQLKLDGSRIGFSTLATATSDVANYSVTPYRIVPLDPTNSTDAAILSNYSFLYLSGTLTIQKLPVKITPLNQTVTYGEFVGGIKYSYNFGGAVVGSEVVNKLESAYRKYLAGNALIVLNGLSSTPSALQNMSTLASFQSLRNARKFLVQSGQMVPVSGTVPDEALANQRFLVDLSAQSLTNYASNSGSISMVNTPPENNARGLIGANALADGTAQAALPNGQLRPMVNGQLLPMVNGSLLAIVNGTVKVVVTLNSAPVTAEDIVFQNGQLRAMVNGTWVVVVSGQIQAVVNGTAVTVSLSVQNGALQASVNGQLMSLVNGQLQASVNGTLLAIVNGQLLSVVNGQLLPLVNGQLRALVNGQLQPVINGQLLALVNGELVVAEYAVLEDDQIKAMVSGQLQPVINGQLMSVINGQLLSTVNGQLMAVINGKLTFVLFNGQLQSLVNGQLQPLVNGQLLAIVNGAMLPVDSYTIINGQLRAVVNGVDYSLVNGQLRPLVNGQLLPVINNFGGISNTNNSNAAVTIDGDDINLQAGALGGMFSVNMITGLKAGVQKLIPGAFFDPNYDVSYGTGEITILKAPVIVDADWKYIYENSPPPPQSFYTSTITGLQYGEPAGVVTGIAYSLTPQYTGAPGVYVITPGYNGTALTNYFPAVFDTGRLYVNPYGKNAKKIIVQRECVRALSAAERAQYVQYNYRYSATFSYTNRNSTPVYIPRGTDNFISIAPGGSFQNSLPEEFLPGTYYVTVLFSGHKMYWQLTSMDTDHKTAITSDVDSSAQKCSNVTTSIRQRSEPEVMAETIEASVYPNPARTVVRIQWSAPVVSDKTIFVMDASGKVYRSLPVRRVNARSFDLTVSSLPAGVYIVRVKTDRGYQVSRFTKL